MDFFEHQEAARGKTVRLLVLFLLAVIAIVGGVYLVSLLIFQGYLWQSDRSPTLASLWNAEWFLAALAGTSSVVLSGSAYKTMSLAAGGQVVAENLGGRLVLRSTTELSERVLLNVVDEMAIAAGVPSPPVYLLAEEPGINAFAAGSRPDHAVIGVTQGCLDWLSRDELQGVIAHEFSHILNGDMRLNLRLIGLLHGILLIGLTGYWIMYSMRGGGRGRHGGFAIFGLGLFVIGYAGVFFARLIKAAVSRQREYLADASAVQFTRHPQGIAGALKKIGGVSPAAHIGHPQAEQASHLFFGNALQRSFLSLLSTHPPLGERIRRIDPTFTGAFPEPDRPRRSERDVISLSRLTSGGARTRPQADDWDDQIAFHAAETMNRIGRSNAEDLEQARTIEAEIPAELHELVRDAFGARAAMYGLLLDEDPQTRDQQLRRLTQHADSGVVRELHRYQSAFRTLAPAARLPLVELAVGPLRDLTRPQLKSFVDNLNHLIKADNQLRLFEFLLRRTMLNHLRHPSDSRRERGLRSRQAIVVAVADVLAALAVVGHRNEEAAASAFAAAMQVFTRQESGVTTPSMRRADLVAADRALGRLSQVNGRAKKRILQACATCIEHDGVATVEETQVFRLIAATLNCPAPLIRPSDASDGA